MEEDILIATLFEMTQHMKRIEERLDSIERQLVIFANEQNPIVLTAPVGSSPARGKSIDNRSY